MVRAGDARLLWQLVLTPPVLGRRAAETRKKLCEKGAVPVLVSTLNNFPDNDSVLANCANAFRELGRDRTYSIGCGLVSHDAHLRLRSVL